MKKTMFSVICLILLPLVAESKVSEIQLAKGEQHQLSVERAVRFSIGNPEVIQVKPITNAKGEPYLLIQGKRLGYSDLVVIASSGEKKYKFRVFAKRTAAFMQDVRRIVANMPGIKAERNGGRWVISGEASSVADFERIRGIAKAQPNKIHFTVRLSSAARSSAFHQIREQLIQAELKGIAVRGVGQTIWLEGKVKSTREKEIAEAIAGSIFPSVKSHILLAFEEAETLRFEVKMLEAIRADKNKTGFSWSTSIPKIFQIHKHFSKGNFSLDSSLEILANRGLIKVLSKPMIFVNERGKAELRVGGEIPLKIQSRYRQNVTWKSYGLLLQIEVPGHANGLTRAKIKIEISDLDYSNAIDGLPGLRVNKMETEVDLSDGKTVFLSGLLQSQKQENEQGIALLKDIPILGELFKSKSFLERKSELLIAVTANSGTRHE